MYHGVTQIAEPRQPAERDEQEAPPSSAREDEPEARDAKDTKDSKDAKKERVLHTRVPAVLERELKRFADNLRVPVSNLVRTILEDALTVADRATERVEEELAAAARATADSRQTLRSRIKPRSVLDEVF